MTDVESPSGEERLSLMQVAAMIGVHRATINSMVRRGKLPAMREGAAWFVQRSAAERLRSSYHRPANAPTPRPPGALAAPRQDLIDGLAQLGVATVSELVSVVRLHEGNIRKNLVILQKRGLAKPDPEGNWALTELGESFVLSSYSA